jgi:hypothetical protein
LDVLEQIAAAPGVLTVGGKTYPIIPPTPGDMLREALQMKQLARACGRRDPLKYVAESAGLFTPQALAIAVSEAVKVGSAPPPEPDHVSVQEQYGLPDGVRWRLWYHLNRSGHAVGEEAAKALVTDFNCGNVCVAIDNALRLPEIGEPKKEPGQPTGTNG